jgi:pimeloyl-ACP methyl ester carboxylesterase
MRRALVVAAVVGAVFAGLVGAAWFGQRHLVYVPDRSDPGPLAEAAPGLDGADVRLRTADGLDLDAWLLHPTGADRDVAVLYLPGNGGNRAGRLDVGRALAAEGLAVLLLDYRGFGGNPGAPSEDGLVADARAGAAYLRSVGFGADRTLYVGESIGTGVTARLAVTDPPAGIVLRSPFVSLADVGAAHYPRAVVERLLRDRFESARHLADSDVPVVVLYGDADDIVPASSSARLAAEVGRLHREVVLPGVGHNDAVWFGPFLAEQVAALADDVIE